MKRKLILLFFTLVIITVTGVNAQIISGADEVAVDSSEIYTHTLGSGSYYWISPHATIVSQDEYEVELYWTADGFYNVQLWQERTPQEDTLLDEKPVVAGNPQMFEYAYDAAGNRISRGIIYYQSQGKKSAKITDPEELLKEENFVGFNVYPNPAKEVLYVVIPPDDNASPDEWDIQLFDNMGRLVLHQKGGSNINELSLSGVKNGYYILRVANKGVRKEWRVVKN
jgi:hypothetical protein